MRVVTIIESSERSRYFEAALPLLSSKGIDVSLITLAPQGPLHTAFDALGIPARSFSVTCSSQYASAVAQLRTLLRLEQPDLVHAHEPIPAVIAGSAALRGTILRRRVVFHRHHANLNGTRRVMSFCATHLTGWTIAVSRSAASAARRQDIVRRTRLLTAYNGVPDVPLVSREQIDDARVRAAVSPGARVVLAVARLRQVKGIDVLLHAAADLPRDVRVVVVGDGPERHSLEALARRLGAPVSFVGHDEEVSTWLQLADVVVIPSRSESFGLVATEAMASQRPLVASDVEGLREVVRREVDGELVAPGSVEQLGEALNRVLSEPNLARSLASNARQRFEACFTVERMVDRWEALYQRILQLSS